MPRRRLSFVFATIFAVSTLSPAQPVPRIVISSAPTLSPAERIEIATLGIKKIGEYFPTLLESESDQDVMHELLDPGESALFEADVERFVTLLDKEGYLNIKRAVFYSWWKANRSEVMNPAQIKFWQAVDLPTLVTHLWLSIAADKLRPADIPKAQTFTSKYGWAIALLLVNLVTQVFGVDALKTYFQSLLKTLNEVLGPVGISHWKFLSIPINKLIGRLTITKANPEDLKRLANELDDGIAELDETPPGSRARDLAEPAISAGSKPIDPILWPNYSLDEYNANMRRFSDYWVECENTYGRAITNTQYHGRNIFFDATIKRAMDFTTAMASYKAVEGLYDLYSYQLQRDILSASAQGDPSRRADMSAVFDSLSDAIRDAHLIEVENRLRVTKDASRINGAQRAIDAEATKFGESREIVRLVDKFISTQKTMLVAADQVVAALSAQFYHDIMHPEYGRFLPNQVREVGRVMLKHFGFPYYVQYYREPIRKILREMKVKIGSSLEAMASEGKIDPPLRNSDGKYKITPGERKRGRFKRGWDRVVSACRIHLRGTRRLGP